MSKELKQVTMYMAKGRCLAPFFGIAYSKKEMRKRFEAFSVDEKHWGYTIVRVTVTQEADETRRS